MKIYINGQADEHDNGCLQKIKTQICGCTEDNNRRWWWWSAVTTPTKGRPKQIITKWVIYLFILHVFVSLLLVMFFNQRQEFVRLFKTEVKSLASRSRLFTHTLAYC